MGEEDRSDQETKFLNMRKKMYSILKLLWVEREIARDI